MNDQERYDQLQREQEKYWESLCGHCGACCGAADGDPCEHLEKLDNGRYWCTIYTNRFGLHKTKSGKTFCCIPIREILHNPWPGDSCCGYKMSFQYVRKIPTFREILKEMPLPADLKNVKAGRDAQIRAVFERRSDKFLLIIGPCSADNEDAVCEYVSRLARVQKKVEDQLILIPRIYTNKPRTTGKGYKGMVHQPVPTEEPDLVAGLKAIRKMHIRALEESRLTAADEMLYPANYPYLEDVLSYVAIGARSVENQQHRLTASGLDIPVGMKNPTSGDMTVMLNSIEAAQHAHTFVYHDWEVQTPGNPLTHAVLRGATDEDGKNIPNYGYDDLARIAKIYLKRPLKNPVVIVDTNHANSGKDFRRQPAIAMDVLSSLRKDAQLKDIVRGLMIESYLVEGAQDAAGGVYGKSITDACLGWEDSEKLILEIADRVAKLL